MGNLWGAENQQLRTWIDWFCHVGVDEPFNFLNHTPFHFCSFLPSATTLICVGRQRQLCPLAASDVPTAVLYCRVPRVIKYAEGCWSPLYDSQKCHVLRVGSHWALVPASRRLWETGNALFIKLYADSRLQLSLCSAEWQIFQFLVQEKLLNENYTRVRVHPFQKESSFFNSHCNPFSKATVCPPLESQTLHTAKQVV